jgi:hypothetical protein
LSFGGALEKRPVAANRIHGSIDAELTSGNAIDSAGKMSAAIRNNFKTREISVIDILDREKKESGLDASLEGGT